MLLIVRSMVTFGALLTRTKLIVGSEADKANRLWMS